MPHVYDLARGARRAGPAALGAGVAGRFPWGLRIGAQPLHAAATSPRRSRHAAHHHRPCLPQSRHRLERRQGAAAGCEMRSRSPPPSRQACGGPARAGRMPARPGARPAPHPGARLARPDSSTRPRRSTRSPGCRPVSELSRPSAGRRDLRPAGHLGLGCAGPGRRAAAAPVVGIVNADIRFRPRCPPPGRPGAARQHAHHRRTGWISAMWRRSDPLPRHPRRPRAPCPPTWRATDRRRRLRPGRAVVGLLDPCSMPGRAACRLRWCNAPGV